jgi:hypothetical protein
MNEISPVGANKAFTSLWIGRAPPTASDSRTLKSPIATDWQIAGVAARPVRSWDRLRR